MSNSDNNLANNNSFRCGMIAIAGRPNVGKSTLLNCLLGQKLSITSKKANTTRNRVLGVLNENDCQFVFIDTPGFRINSKRLVERAIHKVAASNIVGVDVILFVVDNRGWQDADDVVWQHIKHEKSPVIVVISKCDKIKNKNILLPIIKQLAGQTKITDIIPISAKKKENIKELKRIISRYLPEGPCLFPAEFVTENSVTFHASELIREQIFRYCGDELPYSCAVHIEKYEIVDQTLHVHALVWVENERQKKILIGTNGDKLKTIGSKARKNIEIKEKLGVHLRLWVKVRAKWTEDQQMISFLGLSELG